MEESIKQKVVGWLKEIFEGKGLEKLEFEFPYYDPKGGSCGDLIFVDLTGMQNNLKKKYSLLIKKSKDNIVILDKLGLRKGYCSEIEMYSKTIPIIREFAEKKSCTPFENIPECYGTIQRNDQYIIILENLKPKNFKVHEIETPNDLDHLKLVMEAYAKWHAFNFALKDQQPEVFKKLGNTMKGFEKTNMYTILVSTLQNQIDFVVDFYKDKNRPHIIEKLKNLKVSVVEICRKCYSGEDNQYSVIRHGDCWNNNFLFHYNEKDGRPDKVVIIDWQMGLQGSPLADVTQFILYCSSKKELEHLDELIKLYYDALCKKLKELGSDPEKCFPWETCQEDFRKYIPLGIAGMTMAVRMSYRMEPEKCYNIAESVEVGNFNGILGEGISNPDEYFERLDGILELCANRGYF